MTAPEEEGKRLGLVAHRRRCDVHRSGQAGLRVFAYLDLSHRDSKVGTDGDHYDHLEGH